MVRLIYELSDAVISEAASSEPVAWVTDGVGHGCVISVGWERKESNVLTVPLYTHPSISLSDEEMSELYSLEESKGLVGLIQRYGKAIEAKLKGKE